MRVGLTHRRPIARISCVFAKHVLMAVHKIVLSFFVNMLLFAVWFELITLNCKKNTNSICVLDVVVETRSLVVFVISIHSVR